MVLISDAWGLVILEDSQDAQEAQRGLVDAHLLSRCLLFPKSYSIVFGIKKDLFVDQGSKNTEKQLI